MADKLLARHSPDDDELDLTLLRDIAKGFAAGLIATIVLTVLIVAQRVAGVLPGFDAPHLLESAFGGGSTVFGWLYALGVPETAIPEDIGGWVLLWVLGVFAAGGIFAALDAHVERALGAAEMGRGLLFGGIVWLLLMILVAPVGNAGFFAFAFGWLAPVSSGVMFAVFGLVLGRVYGRLNPEPVEMA